MSAKEGDEASTQESYAAESYKTRSDTSISITSSRQHWME